MAFIPAAETWRTALEFTNIDGNKAYNILHFLDNMGPMNLTRATDLANVIETWATAEWVDLAAAEWSLTNIQIRDLTVENGTFLDFPTTVAGAVAGDAAPSSVTIAISLQTGMSGRSFRGRLYHVGCVDTTFNGDYIDLVQRTALINGYELLRSSAAADDFIWAVASFRTNGAPRASALVTQITHVTITDLIADQQRRRKPRT